MKLEPKAAAAAAAAFLFEVLSTRPARNEVQPRDSIDFGPSTTNTVLKFISIKKNQERNSNDRIVIAYHLPVQFFMS